LISIAYEQNQGQELVVAPEEEMFNWKAKDRRVEDLARR